MFTLQQVNWAVDECIRQEVGPAEVNNLLMALDFAMIQKDFHALPTLEITQKMAAIVEPIKAAAYRKTPVVFNQGEPALSAEHIPRQMQLLFNSISEMSIDDFVERLLVIHPWADGNGRTASLVYNWINGTLEAPVTLPKYF